MPLTRYEKARGKVKLFLNAAETREIIFVRGTTEGINLVAQSYGRKFIKAGDEVIISAMEHHSNIVPWQLLCEQTGAVLRVIPMNDDGELLIDEYEKLLNKKTKFVSIVYLSNSLGTINPIKQIIKRAHEFGIPVVVNGAQSTPHLAVDVQELDCDFYAFSGHKVCGPTGIGAHQGLLLHSVYHRPNGWDHVPAGRAVPCGESSMWGDYHLREAALHAQRLLRGELPLMFWTRKDGR